MTRKHGSWRRSPRFQPLGLALLVLAGCSPIELANERSIDSEVMIRILAHEDRRDAADGFLAELVSAEDPAVRRRACLALGRIGDSASIPVLAAAVGDSVPAVRAMAAFALGEMADPGTHPALIAALADPAVEVRFFAMEALTKAPTAEASTAVLQAMSGEPDSKVLGDALHYTFRFQDPQWVPLYLDLASRGGAEGGSAVYALGRLDLEQIEADQPIPEEQKRRWLDALIAASQGSAGFTASVAARRLGNFPGLEVEGRSEALHAALVRPELSVRIEALRAYADLERGSGELWPEVRNLVDDDNGNVRVTALTALGAVGGEQASTILKDRLAHGPTTEKAASLAALFELGLDDLVIEEDWPVRAALAEGLGRDGVAYGEDLLRRLWADPQVAVRYTALASLAARAPEDLTALLTEALGDPDVVVRAVAADLIAGRADVAAFAPALRSSYALYPEEPSNDARLTILEAFAKAELSEDLTAALSDDDWLVRRRAADLLEELDGEPRTVAGLQSRAADDYRRALDPEAPRAVVVTTARGDFEMELLWQEAPLTCLNFVSLVEQGYFDDLSYHRIVPDFVVQDGCPRGDGWGGPGHQIRCEINLERYTEGMVGMALSGKDTGGSQYFITLTPTPHLDGGYTIFARITSGMEVVRSLTQGERSITLRAR